MLSERTTAPASASRDRGQALILFVLAMTVIFVIGVIVVDFSLWLTERRGAQKDGDLATLAGAMELLQQDFVNNANNNPAAIRAAAEDAVYDWADYNELPSTDVHNLEIEPTNCLGPSPFIDSVRMDAEHHGARLFISLVDPLFGTEIGAPARACVGSVVTQEGLLPVAVQIAGIESDCWEDVDGDGQEDPLFGQECVLTFGASDTTSGEGGSIRLYDDGSAACSESNAAGGNDYLDEIEQGGANTTCHVYKYFNDPAKTCSDDPGGCVYPLTGVRATPELNAFETMIASEGECDAEFGNGDGKDQFLEALEAVNGDPTPDPDTIFSERDCVSPRLVSLVIVDQFGVQGNPPMPIEAFAGFFIKGCVSDDGSQFSEKCKKSDFQGGIGQTRIQGFFVNILVTAGDVGHISKWSPKQVVLVE
jgi:Putative Flp pilus-assembly TadE/G-like